MSDWQTFMLGFAFFYCVGDCVRKFFRSFSK